MSERGASLGRCAAGNVEIESRARVFSAGASGTGKCQMPDVEPRQPDFLEGCERRAVTLSLSPRNLIALTENMSAARPSKEQGTSVGCSRLLGKIPSERFPLKRFPWDARTSGCLRNFPQPGSGGGTAWRLADRPCQGSLWGAQPRLKAGAAGLLSICHGVEPAVKHLPPHSTFNGSAGSMGMVQMGHGRWIAGPYSVLRSWCRGDAVNVTLCNSGTRAL